MSDAEKQEAAATQSKPITADDTHCAECEECKEEQRDPFDGWQLFPLIIGVVCFGAGGGSVLLLGARSGASTVASVIALLFALALLAIYARRNIIGQPEFAFLDARGLLHRHLRMPSQYESVYDHDPLLGRHIAHIAHFRDVRRLRDQTDGMHGSDGAQFLVDGAILQLRRGGWFREVKCAYVPTNSRRTWKPQRCWRGMDDLVLRSAVYGGDELHVDPNAPHFVLQFINDPTSSIAQLLHDRYSLQEERAEIIKTLEHERAEHRAAIAESDRRITALEEESAYRLHTITHDASDLVDMLAHFEFGKRAVGRSRHAATLRKLLAHALADIVEHHPNLRTSITNEYGEALMCRPGDFGELMHQRAESGAKHLAAFDAIARRVEQERKAAPQDTAPPAAPPSA